MPLAQENVDDLFGDVGSDGSLFGDGEDSGSLFGEEESDKRSAETEIDAVAHQSNAAAAVVPPSPPTLVLPPLSAITLPPLRDGSISVGLSLPPTGSDPHGALSCDHVGHTSDRQVVSTPNPSGNEWGMAPSAVARVPEAVVDVQATHDQSIDTFASGSHIYGDHEGHVQGGVTSEYSPDLTNDDVIMLDDRELRLQQDILRESSMHRLFGDAQLFGEGPVEVGFQCPHYGSFNGKKLPRQINLDEDGIRFLTPYVSLNRTNSIKRQYERLELGLRLGTKLSKELRGLIQRSGEFAPFLERQSTSYISPDRRRGDYLRLAISLLKHQGWGERWFGALSATGCSRRLIWPAESTLITLRFVSLVYRFVEQMKSLNKKKHATRAKLANSPAPSRCSTGSSQGEPCEPTMPASNLLSNLDDHSQQCLIPTPGSSAPNSRPTSSHMDEANHPESFQQAIEQTIRAVSTLPPPPQPVLPTPSTYDSRSELAQHVVEANQGEYTKGTPLAGNGSTESVTDTGSLVTPVHVGGDVTIVQPVNQQGQSSNTGTTLSADDVPLISNSGRVIDPITTGGGITTIAQLAAHVVDIKRRKAQPPEMRDKPVYRLYFLDKKDGLEFCSPITFDMDAALVQGDVVANLQTAFHAAGEPANIYIYTSDGYRQVKNTKEWQEAVHAVLQTSRNDNTVKAALYF